MFHRNNCSILGKKHNQKICVCEGLFFKKFEDKIHILKGIIDMAWQNALEDFSSKV
jgi:hypothetical protein